MGELKLAQNLFFMVLRFLVLLHANAAIRKPTYIPFSMGHSKQNLIDSGFQQVFLRKPPVRHLSGELHCSWTGRTFPLERALQGYCVICAKHS